MAATNGLGSAFETTKQFIALATGALTITITFADKFKIGDTALSVPLSLRFAWCAYFGVILFGAFTLMAITGTIEAKDQNKGGTSNDGNIRVPAIAMVVFFLVAIALTIRAGFIVTR